MRNHHSRIFSNYSAASYQFAFTLTMSSWAALKKIQEVSKKEEVIVKNNGKKRKRIELSRAVNKSIISSQSSSLLVEVEEENIRKKKKKEYFDVTKDQVHEKIKEKYVALDCEMVGIGPQGKRSALARCAVVDFDGNVLMDKYVRPQAFVTDFRTKYSGIRQKDLRMGKAITFNDCQKEVSLIIKDKILVGHALKNDLDVLMLSHSHIKIRDTATYRPYMRPHGSKGGKFRPRALKDLSRQFLGSVIQTGEHDPAEDARSAMFLYRRCRKEWEETLLIKKNLYVKGNNKEKTSLSTDSITKEETLLRESNSGSMFGSGGRALGDIDERSQNNDCAPVVVATQQQRIKRKRSQNSES